MSDLMITGVIDGPLSGGVPKAIQLYVINDIPDLSTYALGSPNNGGAGGTIEFTFPAVSATAGTTIYIASEDTGFTAFFGFAPDYTGAVASINGDDAIELFQAGVVVDVFGAVGTDGTGEPWEYLDGWAWRNPATSVPSTIFTAADWTFSGPNALDGEVTNDTAATPFPTEPAADQPLVINEIVVSTTGTDREFVELLGNPGESLDGVSLLEIEPGGTIDTIIDFSGNSLGDNGYFLATSPEAESVLGVTGDIQIANNTFTNGSRTYLLVRDFTGASGDDIDADDDGVIDNAPWAEVADSIALIEDDAPLIYSENVVGPDGSFLAPGAYRAPEGTGDFVQHDFSDPSLYTPTPGEEDTTGDPERVTIMEIQGAGHVSGLVSSDPLDPTTGGATGPRIITTGIVTAVDSNGFYLQDAAGDGDIATSDAIFVFTGSAPTVAIGDELDVEGTVSEFYPGGQDTGNLSTTQIGGTPVITVLSTGNALPTSVVLGSGGRVLPDQNIEDDGFTSFDPELDGIDFWESLEGMLVTAPQPVAVSGTSRFGEIFVAVDGGAGATGLSERGTLNISPDDFNPEKVQIDEDFGLGLPAANVGATFQDITGVVSYDFGNYQIHPTSQVVVIEDSELAAETTELAGGVNQLSIASYNVLNLDINDADGEDTDVADGRFDAIASQIVNNLGSPDIIGLQEVQDNDGSSGTASTVVAADQTLQALIDAIDLADDGLMNDSSGYAYIDNTFITDDASGGIPGGNIRTAFLYRTDRVTLVEGSVGTIGSQDPGETFDGARLPLVATFEFNGEEVTVINNHFSSKGGSAPIMGVEQDFAARQEDVTVNGSLDERQAQSEAVGDYVDGLVSADPDANVVVVGDFNEFEFVSPLLNLEENLTNLTNTLPEDERYSFNFQGNSQSLDHILVSGGLAGDAQFDIVHVNSEFAETAGRASDHDPLLALVTVGELPPPTVEVAVDFDPLFRVLTKAVESVDGVAVDTSFVPPVRKSILFDDVDIRVDAENSPGWEKIMFKGGEMGVRSKGERPWKAEAFLLDEEETFVFDLEDGEFGDATGVSLDIGTLHGAGQVALAFYQDGALLEELVLAVEDGGLAADLGGAAFDRVVLSVVGDTALALDGFAFDRIVEDDPLLV